MSNMDLWDKVSKTDPSHTKKVSQRGGFTAIDAHYQVQEATRAFGMIGVGWGYDTDYKYHEGLVLCELTFWHTSRDNKFGPIVGCAQMMGSRVDTDAPKKAMTDALTKALSHLGFNADVFLGKFDDNKYVQELKKEKEAANQPRLPDSDLEDLSCAETLDQAKSLFGYMWKKYKHPDDQKKAKGLYDQVKKAIEESNDRNNGIDEDWNP